MKRLINATLFLALAMATAVPALAETELAVSGQVRLRDEADRRSFDSDTSSINTFSLLRTRVNFDATVNGNTHAFVQLQDSRMLGGMDAFSGGQSATLNDGESVDLHQAYIKIDNLFGKGWGAMGGRFEFNLGNQRLFGAVGWHNVGRAMEGGALWYDNEKMRVTAYNVKVREDLSMTGNTDFDVGGLHLNLKEQGLEFFVSADIDATELSEATDILGAHPVSVDTSKTLQRITLGGYTHREFGDNDLTANIAFQTGHQMIATDSADFFLKQDISAIMLAAEFGHKFNDKRNSRVAVGFDYTSGDEGTDSLESKTFNNLYYTGHKFRGYMDYFGAPHGLAGGGAIAAAGLMDIMLRGQTDITDGWTLKADIHMFKTAQDYTFDSDTSAAVTLETSSDLGMEIDLTVVTTRVQGIKLVNGVSVFMAKDDWVASMKGGDPEKQTGFWAYSQAIVNF